MQMALKQRLPKYEHKSALAEHPGSQRMYDTLRRYFYWLTIVVHIYKHVEQCRARAKNRLSERRRTSAMRLCPAREPLLGLEMDLLGPLTNNRGGHMQALVTCDWSHKQSQTISLRNATALTVASAFIGTWGAAYNIPDSVLAENGPQAASVYYQGIFRLLGIVWNFTAPYHPQTNGHVERYDRTSVRQLR